MSDRCNALHETCIIRHQGKLKSLLAIAYPRVVIVVVVAITTRRLSPFRVVVWIADMRPTASFGTSASLPDRLRRRRLVLRTLRPPYAIAG